MTKMLLTLGFYKDNIEDLTLDILREKLILLTHEKDPSHNFAILTAGKSFIQTIGDIHNGFSLEEYRDKTRELFEAKKMDYTFAEIEHFFVGYFEGKSDWDAGVEWDFYHSWEEETEKTSFLSFIWKKLRGFIS